MDFPKTEPWGPMECPYPTTPFEVLKEALLGGGQCATFVHPERAVANLIGAAWRDGAWDRVFAVCTGKRSMAHLVGYLKEVLNEMKMADKIVKANDEKLQLVDGKALWAAPAKTMYMRGVNCDQLIFVQTDPILEVAIPMLEMGREVHQMIVAFDDHYERRQRESPHSGPWNATLRLRRFERNKDDEE